MQGHNLLLGKPNRALGKNFINAKSHESTTTSMKSTIAGSKVQIQLFGRLLPPSVSSTLPKPALWVAIQRALQCTVFALLVLVCVVCCVCDISSAHNETHDMGNNPI